MVSGLEGVLLSNLILLSLPGAPPPYKWLSELQLCPQFLCKKTYNYLRGGGGGGGGLGEYSGTPPYGHIRIEDTSILLLSFPNALFLSSTTPEMRPGVLNSGVSL